MERKALHILPLVIVVVVSLLGLNPHLALGADTDDDERPGIAGIQTKPEGQTYGRWAAQWWQWALGVPRAVNPLTDTTGEHCAQRQVDQVWFLAGSFLGPGPIVRTCEIPAGKSLFFPLINTFFGAELDDPPEERTEEFVRKRGSCDELTQISVEIDGFEIRRPLRFFTGASGSQSPIFNVQLPPRNVAGARRITTPELVLTPSAEQGYHLFVRPLSPGTHTIRWIASGCSRPAPEEPVNVQDITYHLKVGDSPKH
jgi:hypothetical protein